MVTANVDALRVELTGPVATISLVCSQPRTGRSRARTAVARAGGRLKQNAWSVLVAIQERAVALA